MKLVEAAFVLSRVEHLEGWIDEFDAIASETGAAHSEHAAWLAFVRTRWLAVRGLATVQVVMPGVTGNDGLMSAWRIRGPFFVPGKRGRGALGVVQRRRPSFLELLLVEMHRASVHQPQ